MHFQPIACLYEWLHYCHMELIQFPHFQSTAITLKIYLYIEIEWRPHHPRLSHTISIPSRIFNNLARNYGLQHRKYAKNMVDSSTKFVR